MGGRSLGSKVDLGSREIQISQGRVFLEGVDQGGLAKSESRRFLSLYMLVFAELDYWKYWKCVGR